MTAIIAVCQPRHDLVQIVTDAAIYREGAGIVAFGNKVHAVPHWPGIVTTAGNAAASPLFGWALAKEFASWEDLIEGASTGVARLAEMVAEYGIGHATVILAGISEKRGPEAYTFQTSLTFPPGVSQEDAEASEYYARPFALVKLPDVIMTPVAPPEMSIAASYEGIDPDADPELVTWSMRKVLTMQRHMPMPDGVGGIGGFGQLTTIVADGITQRIVDRWSDKLGVPLRPGPIDWKAWHADNPKPSARMKLRVV